MLRDLGLAFAAGLVACASACVLPLLPVFVAYMGGTASRLKAAGNSLIFVAGFSTAFVGLGAGAGLLGGGLATYRQPLLVGSGVILVAVGVALLGGIPWLMRERRPQLAHRLPHTPGAAYLIGLAFALGWTPCVGPILAAVLVVAANSATAARGALLLAAYSAGLGLPFVLAGLFLGPVTALIHTVRGLYPVVNAVAAVFLIGMGVLTLTNRLTVLNTYFPNLVPYEVGGHLSAQPVSSGSPSALVGKHPPSLTVTALDGKRTTIDFKPGNPAIITFWATWCIPCREELPLFAAAYRDHRAQGLMVVAVDYEESPEAVARFWQDLGLEPAPYLDPDGSAARRFGVGLQETGLPISILVGRDGSVKAVLAGEIDSTAFKASLEQLLTG